MTWRKYVVRGLVFSILGALASAGWLYQRLTSPDTVRQQVAAKLESHFRTTDVRLDSASLRLLGGISFNELRLVRQNDPEKNDLLYVPAGIIYHDKEQLLDGKLAIRKLELHRPRWHFIRQRDGSWNSANLLGPVDLNESLPTIVIRHGTILIEDRLAAPDAAPVEFRDVNLTMINDPRPTITVQLKGESDLTGPLAARAVWDRASEAINLRVETPALPIGPALAARLQGYCAAAAEHARHLQGTARIEADLAFDPQAEHPWSHRFTAGLSAGTLRHPALPVDLEQVEAKIRCQDDWLRIDALQARSGPARVDLTGLTVRGFSPDGDLDLEKLTVADLPVTPELFARLPAGMRKFQADYAPAGKVNLEVEAKRRDGKWERQSTLSTTDMRAAFAKFPYPLTRIQGTITEQLDQARHVEVHRIDLVGAGSGGRPVHLQGVVAGEAPHAAVHLDIWGDNAPIDETLLASLPEKQQKLAREFHPTAGKVDFVVQVRRPEGATEFANRYTIRLHDAVARYDQFRYPLENVSGVLEVHPHHFEFHDFTGGHKGGTFVTAGRSHPGSPGQPERVSINIQGKNILLDDELAAALAPKLQETWKALNPTGRVSFETQIEQVADHPDDMTVVLNANGCTLRPAFLPYLLNEVSGTVRYGQGKVNLTNLAGRHGPTVISLGKGEIHLKPTGGFWARLADLQGRPLVLDAEFRAALPPPLRKVCELAAPNTPVGLGVEVIVDMPSEPNVPPDVYWDGGIALQDATLNAGVDLEKVRGQLWCQGRHDGRQLKGVKGNLLLDQALLFRQPFRNVHSHIVMSPDAPEVLRLPDLKAAIFGGDVGGEVRVEFGPTIHYDVNLTALQVRLEEIGQHNLGAKEEWKGLASGRLFLSGHGTDIHGLEGSGQIDVPRGQMYNLPLLLDLIKVLGLRTPDRTAFEEAHASFSIKGPRLLVSRLDLDGNAISLSGQGEMNLDGTDLQLDFYAVWGRIKQMLPPIVREIPPALGQQLLKIKMRGSMQDVKIDKEPVPALVEPLERLLKRFTARGVAVGKGP